MLYHLELDALSEFTGISVEDLKQKSYKELEHMIYDMHQKKQMDKNKQNLNDEEFARVIEKYFTPLAFLKQWWSLEEIIIACAMTGISIRDLCQEMYVEVGCKCHLNTSEYLRTSVESVPQYDKQGNELLQRRSMKVDVYRIKNRYQGLCHGKVIQYLLYQKYPELEQFKFAFYEYYGYENHKYEIYPANHIYVPFEDLMSKNIDGIIKRNEEYCKSYNHGAYSPEEWTKRLQSEETQQFFEVIKNLA